MTDRDVYGGQWSAGHAVAGIVIPTFILGACLTGDVGPLWRMILGGFCGIIALYFIVIALNRID